MPTVLTPMERREVRAIVKAGRAGRKTHKYFRARALLALDKGLSPEVMLKLLRIGVVKREPREAPVPPLAESAKPTFEEDLQYVLDKNAELYRRLAR